MIKYRRRLKIDSHELDAFLVSPTDDERNLATLDEDKITAARVAAAAAAAAATAAASGAGAGAGAGAGGGFDHVSNGAGNDMSMMMPMSDDYAFN